MKIEDKDIDKDPDTNSKDTSMNYKVIGGSMGGIVTRVASMYLMASRVADRHLLVKRVASRYFQAKEDSDKEKEEKKKSLIKRKEAEAWSKFVEKERIKDPETNREVSWTTFEKKYPKDAQKIRRDF